MAQRTTIDEIRAYVMPLTAAAFGWYMTSMISEVRSDVKLLLESKAIHGEQIEQYRRRLDKLESRVFGIGPISLVPHFMQFVFDKTKMLQYKNGEFYYS